VTLEVPLVLWLITLPLRIVRSVIRFVGLKNTLFTLIGVGIGLLVAPTPGRELRARLAAQLEARRPSRALAVDELDVEVVGVETVRA
jgi:hypothetical protein